MKTLDSQKLDDVNKTRSNICSWRGRFTPQFVVWDLHEAWYLRERYKAVHGRRYISQANGPSRMLAALRVPAAAKLMGATA